MPLPRLATVVTHQSHAATGTTELCTTSPVAQTSVISPLSAIPKHVVKVALSDTYRTWSRRREQSGNYQATIQARRSEEESDVYIIDLQARTGFLVARKVDMSRKCYLAERRAMLCGDS